jgi:hypothetical protein
MELKKILLTSITALPFVIASAFIYPTNKDCDALKDLEIEGRIVLNKGYVSVIPLYPDHYESEDFMSNLRKLMTNCPLDKTYRI